MTFREFVPAEGGGDSMSVVPGDGPAPTWEPTDAREGDVWYLEPLQLPPWDAERHVLRNEDGTWPDRPPVEGPVVWLERPPSAPL